MSKVAPITGMLRRKFIFDLTGSLALGTACAAYFWWGVRVPQTEARMAKLKDMRKAAGLPVTE